MKAGYKILVKHFLNSLGLRTEKIEIVDIKAPLPTKDGIIEEGKASKSEAIKYPETEEEADRILAEFEKGQFLFSCIRYEMVSNELVLGATRADDQVNDSVGHHALITDDPLHSEAWLGDEDEERECYITELLYIHSKIMIVDDRKVIMGSANFNDRSQKGNGDSEIAVVVEDEDLIDSTMDGQPVCLFSIYDCQSLTFCHSTRLLDLLLHSVALSSKVSYSLCAPCLQGLIACRASRTHEASTLRAGDQGLHHVVHDSSSKSPQRYYSVR